MDLCLTAKHLWEMYFDGDYEKYKNELSIFDPDCVILGTKKGELFRGIEQFDRFLQTARTKESGVHFEFDQFWCEEMVVSPEVHLVYGGVQVWWEMPETKARLDVDSQFTMLFRLVDGAWKLVHVNQSLPNESPVYETQRTNSLTAQIRKVQDQMKKLQKLASKDSLTGLTNLRALRDIYSMADRKGQWLVMVDVDNFKMVNDTYGHPAGDKVLKRVAELLQNSVRDTDTVARVGGDEFIILFTCPRKEILKKRLESLKDNVRRESKITEGMTSFSMGAIQLLAGESFDDALKRVDTAMYATKKSGKNGFTIL